MMQHGVNKRVWSERSHSSGQGTDAGQVKPINRSYRVPCSTHTEQLLACECFSQFAQPQPILKVSRHAGHGEVKLGQGVLVVQQLVGQLRQVAHEVSFPKHPTAQQGGDGLKAAVSMMCFSCTQACMTFGFEGNLS